MLEDEALLVEQRENTRIASEASLINSAINAAFSKDAAKDFAKTVKSLQADLVIGGEEAQKHQPTTAPTRTDLSGVDVAAAFGPKQTT